MARWSRRRDERGATAVLAAILLTVVLMTSAAFTVDLGQQRVVRSDMQAVADMASLDLSRLLTGGTVSSYSTSTFNTALANSLARNDSSYGDVVTSQGECSSTGLATTVKAGACWEFADSSGTGEFTATQTPTAVKVYARSETGFLFGGFTKVNAGGATRSAVASSAAPSVCFSIGTRTLTLNTDQSALSPFLTNILKVNLSAVGYDGIIGLTNVSVPMADLMVKLGVGSYDQMLTTSVSLGSFIVAAADALKKNGDTADADVLRGISIGVSSAQVQLSKILNLASGTDTSALTANVNVFDILSAAIIAANGQHAVAVSVPGVTNVTVIEPPQIACGSEGIVAHSAQISATIAPTVVTSVLNSLGIASANVNLTLTVGDGTATLTALGCAPETATLDVSTDAAKITGDIALGISVSKVPGIGAVLAGTLKLLGISTLGLDATVGAEVAASDYPNEVVDFPGPPSLPAPLVVPSKNAVGKTLTLSGTDVTSTDSSLIGDVLKAVLALVKPLVLTTIVPGLDTAVISPVVNTLLSTLGIKLGVAEVDMLSDVGCDNVKLIG